MRGTFDIDDWVEILNTIKKNKLRTFLTGFSIGWGIFMLIALMAVGNGLKNGIISNFGERAKNVITLNPYRTSIPFMGNSANRSITLDDRDLELLKTQVPGIDEISARISKSAMTSYNFESSDCRIDGVYPLQKKITGIRVESNNGRFINEIDIKNHRKVAVINSRLHEILFKGTDPVGKSILVNDIAFTVIGVYKGGNEWGDSRRAYIPFSTAQLLFNQGWGIQQISFTINGLDTEEKNKTFEVRLRHQLASLHRYDPNDEQAIYFNNRMEDYLQTVRIFDIISVFVIFTSVFTLIAGVVGVSNIMLITVRERTRELGIRKALGAKPWTILQSILMESVFITTIFGYAGMVIGVGLSEMASLILEAAATTSDHGPTMFKDPTISLSIAIGATCLMIIAGAIAGFFPARKAVRVSAVEAMRAE